MKRAAFYVRVSTPDQHPETQLRELREYAQRRGLTTLTRRFRTLLLSNLRACWRDPFGLPHEKR